MAYDQNLRLGTGISESRGVSLADFIQKEKERVHNYEKNAQNNSNNTTTPQIDLKGGFSQAASAASAGQDSNSPAAASVQGAMQGAGAAAAFGAATPQGLVLGAGVGALAGIMNAKANQQKEADRIAREKAGKLSDIYREEGAMQQNALANIMSSYNNILAPRPR